MAAPTGSGSLQELLESPEEWLNPCGDAFIATDEVDSSAPLDSDASLLHTISVEANNSLKHVESFSRLFTTALGNDYQSPEYESIRYNWLPTAEDIPKKLGMKLSPEYLNSLELASVLRKTYEFLQKYAVGIEQIRWDQNQAGGEFVNNLTTAESYLRLILCEVRTMMVSKSLELPEPVHRSIMGMDFRVPRNSTQRSIRDWVIFRDYINALEYFAEVFNHLHNTALANTS